MIQSIFEPEKKDGGAPAEEKTAELPPPPEEEEGTAFPPKSDSNTLPALPNAWISEVVRPSVTFSVEPLPAEKSCDPAPWLT